MNKSFLSFVSILTILMILPSFSFAQNNGGGYLMIRVFESRDKSYNKIIVTENGTKLEEIELVQSYYKDLETAQIEINKTLDKYENNGYNLTQTTSSGANISGSSLDVFITTYLFKKE